MTWQRDGTTCQSDLPDNLLNLQKMSHPEDGEGATYHEVELCPALHGEGAAYREVELCPAQVISVILFSKL